LTFFQPFHHQSEGVIIGSRWLGVLLNVSSTLRDNIEHAAPSFPLLTENVEIRRTVLLIWTKVRCAAAERWRPSDPRRGEQDAVGALRSRRRRRSKASDGDQESIRSPDRRLLHFLHNPRAVSMLLLRKGFPYSSPAAASTRKKRSSLVRRGALIRMHSRGGWTSSAVPSSKVR
jgi:hypothetical protein